MRDLIAAARPWRVRALSLHALAALACLVPPPCASAAQAVPSAQPFQRVHYILDVSGSMRARFGHGTKLDAARRALEALDRGTAAGLEPPSVTLWGYGARSDRRRRDCEDAGVLARGRRGSLAQALAGLEPRGVSPLVRALEGVLASATGGREAWVVFTDGTDTCGRDPCEWAARVLARPQRPRIYVVGLGLVEEDARALRCLTDATSGYVLNVAPDEPGEREMRRLADVIRNRGQLRIDTRLAGEPGPALAGRVFPAGSDRPLRTIRTGRPEELPGGMYRVVVETVPPTTFERVLVLPGDERVLAIDDLARLSVAAYSPGNEPVPSSAWLFPADGSGAEQYLTPGEPAFVRAGRYRLTLLVADSAALRETLEIAPGEAREVTVGGTGWVRARAPGLAELVDVEIELQRYADGSSTALRPWKAPAGVPAGEYRAVIRTLPAWVREGFTVAPAETSALVVPGLGTLRVDVTDSTGRSLSVPVTLLRREESASGEAEPAPGGVLGTFRAGSRQAVMAGTYDIVLETVPLRVERGVRVEPGTERVISLAAPGTQPDGGGS